MASKYIFICFFIVSLILQVTSKVCTKQETTVQVLTYTAVEFAKETYTTTCLRDDTYNYYDYSSSYSETTYECTKTKMAFKPVTKTREVPTVKIVKTCCEGYRSLSVAMRDGYIFCVPIDETTTETTEISTKADRNSPYENVTISDNGVAPKDSKNDTRTIDIIIPKHPWSNNATVTNDHELPTTSTTQQYTTGRSTTSHIFNTAISFNLTTTATTDSESDDFTNAKSTWMAQNWPAVILPVIILIFAAVIVWRWTFIKFYLAGQYNVNDAYGMNSCSNATVKCSSTNTDKLCDVHIDTKHTA